MQRCFASLNSHHLLSERDVLGAMLLQTEHHSLMSADLFGPVDALEVYYKLHSDFNRARENVLAESATHHQ